MSDRQCFTLDTGDRVCGVAVLASDGVTLDLVIDRIEIARAITPEDAARAVELARSGVTVAFFLPGETEACC